MARIGVKREDVWQACDRLLAKGSTITIANVRNELGTGSYSTLLPIIKEYNEKTRENARQTTQVPPLPEPLLDLAKRFTTDLWAQANRLSETRAEEEKFQLRERESELNAALQLKSVELDQAHKEIIRLEEQIRELDEKFKSRTEAFAATERRASEATAKVDLLESQLKTRDAEVRALLERAARAEQELSLLKSKKSSSLVGQSSRSAIDFQHGCHTKRRGAPGSECLQFNPAIIIS